MSTEAERAPSTLDVESDCSELRSMLVQAKRPSVRKELQRVLDKFEAELQQTKARCAAPSAAAAPAVPAATAVAVAKPAAVALPSAPAFQSQAVKPTGPWTEITTFGLDLGGYDKPLVTIDIRLKGVEILPSENVTCDFTEASLDLKVVGLDGQNYRFLKTNLDKDIVSSESTVKVKKNHVIVTLQKKKGDLGYDHWADLCAKGKRKPAAEKKNADPGGSIMDMMKDLYDDGDDSMKKIIGEAMYKARRGEKQDSDLKSDDPKKTNGVEDIDDM